MNDPRIANIRTRFLEKDLRLSDCAARLMCRIYSYVVLEPKLPATEKFDMPCKQVMHWCGLTDKHNASDRLDELVACGYLYDEGVRGCPQTRCFKLNLKVDHTKLVTKGLDGTFKDGVIHPLEKRKGNKDAAKRKAVAAMKAAVK